MLPRLRLVLRPALGLLFLSLTLCACGPKITAPPEPPLAVRLGDDAFRLQDYEAAIDDYRVYIDSVDHGEYTPFAFYQTALCWYRIEQFEQCLDTLDELSRRYRGETWVQVEALRGDALYRLGRRTAALIAWDEGWSVAKASERPELRRRIVGALREMDEAELAESTAIVDSPEVEALVRHHLAIRRPDLPAAPAPVETETKVAEAPEEEVVVDEELEVVEVDEDSTVSEVVLQKTEEKGSSADAVAEEAEMVAAQVDEADLLADEVDETGNEAFEAIRETEEARGQIAEVDASSAGFAPLLRVEIPEPPVVDRPVPEPKKILRVGSPAEIESGGGEPVAAAEPAPQAAAAPVAPIVEDDFVPDDSTDLQRVDAPPVEIEPVVLDTDAKVACVLPLTGADRGFGEGLLRGIRLVFGEGSNNVVFRDSGSDPASAQELVGELAADDDVLIAIVPATARDVRALARQAETAAVPTILLSSSNVPASRYVMRVGPGDAQGGFAASYRDRYGSAPDAVNAQAYEAALLARQALEIAPVSREDVLSHINARSAVDDTTGRVEAGRKDARETDADSAG